MGAPERGPEFLCAEFTILDGVGKRRTFLYLTAAKGQFVKLRVTLQTNDATDPTARNFADAFASRFLALATKRTSARAVTLGLEGDDPDTAIGHSGGIASKTTAGILESEYEAGKITHRWDK